MIGRMLAVDCRRALRGTFGLAILLTLVIQMQGMGEYLAWILEGTSHSYVLFDLHFSFSTGTFQLFMPTVAALVYSASYLADRQSGFLRYQLLRTGRSSAYLLSKALITYLSTLCAVFLGVLLFAAFLRARMPLVDMEYVSDMNGFACGALCKEGKYVLFLLCSAFFKASAAASWALFALMLSTITQNHLAVYVLPTIACYALNILMSRLGLGSFSSLENGTRSYGSAAFDFVRISGLLLAFSLTWAAIFFLRARRQVRA